MEKSNAKIGMAIEAYRKWNKAQSLVDRRYDQLVNYVVRLNSEEFDEYATFTIDEDVFEQMAEARKEWGRVEKHPRQKGGELG